MIFFSVYHPNACANNVIQAVFHFGLLIIRLSSSTIPFIEPYDLQILCMLTNISSEFRCFRNEKGHLCTLVEDDPCLFSQMT